MSTASAPPHDSAHLLACGNLHGPNLASLRITSQTRAAHPCTPCPSSQPHHIRINRRHLAEGSPTNRALVRGWALVSCCEPRPSERGVYRRASALAALNKQPAGVWHLSCSHARIAALLSLPTARKSPPPCNGAQQRSARATGDPSHLPASGAPGRFAGTVPALASAGGLASPSGRRCCARSRHPST